MTQITTVATRDDTPIREVRLGTVGGPQVTLLTLGARVTQLWAADSAGRLADIVLGHDGAEGYLTNHGYLGATCGRFANRIGGARFSFDGVFLRVIPNEGDNQLHGGPVGFDSAIWDIADHGADHVTFAHVSPDGDMGFPGRVKVLCTYRWDGARLGVEMTATTDAPTVVNLAHHSYFNLAGQGSGPVLDHELQIEADHYLPVDAANIPTGAVLPVAGTPFDLTRARPIGAEMPGPGGFDHCFCLSRPLAPVDGQPLRPAATLGHMATGRRLRLWTDQPGLQVYTGAHFNGTPGKAGATYGPFAGVALETQGFPDSPNHPQFPQATLLPGQTYRHRMRIDLTPLP